MFNVSFMLVIFSMGLPYLSEFCFLPCSGFFYYLFVK
jgi:hypothetical protein